MADNLIFPIGFDLEKAVETAIKDWDGKYADKLEKAIQKRALGVKLKFDTKAFDNLDDVKRRLAELKITPLTPENKQAIQDLTRELKGLAKLMEKISSFKGVELPELQMAKAAKLRKDAELANEKYRLSQERVRQADERLILSQQRAEQQAKRTGSAFNTQSGYLNRLVKRMAVYASFSYASNFLTSVREVTAEFELQRVSLGAIIQDQIKANQLFSEIKSFALKSPVKILDLTKYTKQLAAYKIGVDELFETTKRLTDVSVGLGVSMERIVLFYGQVRAKGWLTAQDLKQATEAGIPLTEELAKKLSAVNGELVTAGQVMDMISKRQISFEQVKEVFDDMTSAGGIFYNMQEKQGNTLYGMWAKLGDAASVMYEEIGNTGSVNSAMKATIQLLTDLMRNWQTVAQSMVSAGVALAGVALYKNIVKRGEAAAQNTVTKAIKARVNAQRELTVQTKIGTAADKAAAEAALKKALADEKAAIAAQKSAKWGSKFKSGLLSIGKSLASGALWSAAIAGVMALGNAIFGVSSKIDKVNEKLSDAMGEAHRLIRSNTDNFIRLAERVAGASVIDGSRDQKEALEELQRTFGNMIPQEELTIENLKRLRSGAENASEAYKTLTKSIESYIVQLQKQQAEEGIKNIYGPNLKNWKSNLTDNFIKEGLGLAEAEQFFGELDKILAEGTEKVVERYDGMAEKLEEAKKQTGVTTHDAYRVGLVMSELRGLVVKDALEQTLGDNKEMIDKMWDSLMEDAGKLRQETWLQKYIKDMLAETDSLTGVARAFDKISDSAKKLNEMKKGISDYMENLNFSVISPEGGDKDFAEEQTRINLHIQKIADTIRNSKYFKEAFEEAGVQIDAGWFDLSNKLENGMAASTIDFEAIFEALKGKSAPELRDWLTELQKIYKDGLIPSNETVAQLRAKMFEISTSIEGLKMKDLKMYLWDGSGEIKKHLKDTKEQIEQHEKNVYMLQKTAARQLLTQGFVDAALLGEIEKSTRLIKALKEYYKFAEEYDPGELDKGRGTKSDPRLQTLQEIANKMAEVNKEYDELLKKEGQTKALADTQKLFASSFKQMKATAKKYGFKLPAFEVPQTIEDVQKWYKAIMDNIKRLGLKKADKVLIELGFKSDKAAIDKQQKDIESELKRLADRISRTKTAKEFYEKILSQTGDVELAANVAIHVYGEQGKNLNEQIRKQIETLLEPSGIKIDAAVFRADGTFDPKKLREFAEAQKEALGGIESKAYQELIKLSDNAEKDFAKTIEGWLKAVEKAKGFTDKMLDLARRTRTEIDAITTQKGYAETRVAELLGLGDLDAEQSEELKQLQGFLAIADNLIQGFKDKQAKEQGALTYEAFKDSPMYVQMFDDLDHASTRMLENMKSRMEGLKAEWKNLTPTQLKEMQSRLNEIDAQLAKRNPFKTLAKSISDYRKLSKSGSKKRADDDLVRAEERRAQAEAMLKEAAPDSEAAKFWQQEYEAAEAAAHDAEKVVENWKKVEDMIGLSANELFQMLNWAGDIAKGIADISEAMGADEEDVQYWNDVADALGQISGGIQDIVSAAMSGNVVGIISSTLTAIPKMFVGFTNLFSAGKIKKANKEIKRQQELLDQLAYTYSRLEAAADKVLGADYLNNYKRQIQTLQAQAQAYQKQAAAERSKGKKADKGKIKEYEDAYRETMDAIADMQGQIAAQMLGTDLTSAARDFAKAWLDAYKEFGNTADAMSKKFHEMVENMVVESLLAKVMERALKPMFDMIDNMSDRDFYSQSFWEQIAAKAEQGAKDADYGAQSVMKFLEKAGISMRDISSEYTGIKRDIAGASEETMSSVAVIGNTLMYYVSPIPAMSENVAAIRAIMENRTPSASQPGVDMTAMWNRHLELQQGIYENTRKSAEKCEAMAVKCAQMADDIHKVIAPRGSSASSHIQVRM